MSSKFPTGILRSLRYNVKASGKTIYNSKPPIVSFLVSLFREWVLNHWSTNSIVTVFGMCARVYVIPRATGVTSRLREHTRETPTIYSLMVYTFHETSLRTAGLTCHNTVEISQVVQKP